MVLLVLIVSFLFKLLDAARTTVLLLLLGSKLARENDDERDDGEG
jgi:hypothetical protein